MAERGELPFHSKGGNKKVDLSPRGDLSGSDGAPRGRTLIVKIVTCLYALKRCVQASGLWCFLRLRNLSSSGSKSGPEPERVATGRCGTGIQVDKITGKISGRGRAYADTIIEQDRAYFEIVLLENSVLYVGVAADLEMELHLGESPRSHGILLRGEKSDVIAVKYDQSDRPEATIYFKNEVHKLQNMKGDMYPAASLESGSFRWEFMTFTRHRELDPAEKFTHVMKSRNILL